MPRIALFSTECAQLGDALETIIERHHDDIAVVVTSDVYATSRGGLLKQTYRNLRRSGLGFMTYLTYSFMLYPAVVRADRLLAPLRGGRRNRRSVEELCRAHGIEYVKTGNVNSPAVAAKLEEADLDFIVIYWFDQILRERVIAAPKRAVINVHAAFLPHCRGLFPTLFSALEPGTPFGISAHLIENREIDAGPVLAQRVAVPPAGRSVLFNDSWVNRAGVGMLDEILAGFDGFLDEASPQPEGGSYYSYPERHHVAQARRNGLRLVTPRDFLAVVRGTGATDSDGHHPDTARAREAGTSSPE